MKINTLPSAKNQINFASRAAPPMGQYVVRASGIFGNH